MVPVVKFFPVLIYARKFKIENVHTNQPCTKYTWYEACIYIKYNFSIYQVEYRRLYWCCTSTPPVTRGTKLYIIYRYVYYYYVCVGVRSFWPVGVAVFVCRRRAASTQQSAFITSYFRV